MVVKLQCLESLGFEQKRIVGEAAKAVGTVGVEARMVPEALHLILQGSTEGLEAVDLRSLMENLWVIISGA